MYFWKENRKWSSILSDQGLLLDSLQFNVCGNKLNEVLHGKKDEGTYRGKFIL